MTNIPTKAGLIYRLQAKIKSHLGYRRLLRQNSSKRMKPINTTEEEQLNTTLSGYPRNHDYQVHDGQLLPSFRLYERFRLISEVLPSPLESFLDIGCCRGYYVIDAALRKSCQTAVGLDVSSPFVDLAGQVSNHLGLSNTAFHVGTIDQVVANPQHYQAPFQTVLLIGSYHYLFWGSEVSPICFGDHETILEALSKLCTQRLIISARLEFDRLPDSTREIAMGTEQAKQYNTETFLRVAERYFTISCTGFLGTYPLLVLDKKH